VTDDQALTPPVRRGRLGAVLATVVIVLVVAAVAFAVAARWTGGGRGWARAHLAGAVAPTILICGIYLAVVFAWYAALLVFSALEQALRAHERRSEDFQTLAGSRFTIPVSIIAAVYNERPVVVSSVASLLDQEYPEFEVITVDDGSTDGTFEELRDAFELEPEAMYPRLRYDTRAVAGTYRSRTDPRLLVVRKLNGGKADALNCGLNYARFRYVLGVDGDTIYRRAALLHGMRLAIRDPARVIGVTSHIAISFEPERSLEEVDGYRRVDASLLCNFQHLDYLRSFLNNRLGWTRLGFMLCSVGAFHIWRRDVLEEVGGFSRRFTCEDIELTFRIHERFRREGREYAIVALPDTVATTEGPNSIRALIKQRARWQRVIAETVWHYRRMLFNPRYGSVGLLGLPFYLVTEMLAPVFEVLAILATLVGIWSGALNWVDLALVVAVLSVAAAVLSAMAVLMEDRTTRSYRIRDLLRLQLIAPLDLVLYRPLHAWARVRGTIDFLRGRRDWDKFERNRRPAARTVSSR
jgi:poly-beta-1,6-N-acetyl-D-glucosamine synthase